jgi:hypothetical protein
MITAHRDKMGEMTKAEFASVGYVDSEASFGTDMILTVGLSRYSSGGRVTLYFDGARSTAREMTATQIAKIQATANRGVGYENQMRELRGETATASTSGGDADGDGEIQI